MALTISGSGGGVTASDVLTMLSGYGKVETGSYTGKGGYNSDNPTSLTFQGDPSIVVIRAPNSSYARYLIFFPAIYTSTYTTNLVIQIGTAGSTSGYVSSLYYAKYSQNDKTLSWYYTSAGNGSSWQMDYSGSTYYWFAITV